MTAATILGLHHIAIAAADAPALARFYADAAAFEPWPAAAALWPDTQATWLAHCNMGLCLLPAAPGAQPLRHPVSEAGFTHLCLQTTHIQALQRRFAAAHASFHCDPIDLGTGFLYCYARDPEFNITEIECVPPVWPDPAPWVAHINLASADLKRTVDFYAQLLGSAAVRSPKLQRDSRLNAIADLPDVQLRMAWLQTANAQIEVMQYHAPATTEPSARRRPGAPGFVHLALEVSDLAAATQHLRACGGQASDPAPGAFFTDATDADGNHLRLLDLSHPARRSASIQALRDPHINQRFAAARAALSKAP